MDMNVARLAISQTSTTAPVDFGHGVLRSLALYFIGLREESKYCFQVE